MRVPTTFELSQADRKAHIVNGRLYADDTNVMQPEAMEAAKAAKTPHRWRLMESITNMLSAVVFKVRGCPDHCNGRSPTLLCPEKCFPPGADSSAIL